ncbi:cytochrome c [Bradyrhizobium sp. 41S5]|uniref:c-type cytochrome n=1 Tax=Bradyrhizobium sp. 41S5 TaxID=1404443 RepID=UPI00156AFAD2|nr:cytochrome c [Bradyrhizobium sp. 41S5]UFX43957.1 cytochrome c [Bradyrhizobium sp. 41S5]
MSSLSRLFAAGVVAGVLGCGTVSAVSGESPHSSTSTAKPTAKMGLGRQALPEEIAAWDTDVRPDGRGLPVGRGTVKQGDDLFQERCASCHGEFGQGAGRWPVLAGGQGTLKADRPDKTIGSFWPDLSTVYDYIKRAMPYGNARSLTDDEAYALVAFLLNLNDIVKDENFELSDKNFTSIKMPNADAFFDDDREASEKRFWNKDPCMSNCRDVPHVTGKAISIDVTPDGKSGPKVD